MELQGKVIKIKIYKKEIQKLFLTNLEKLTQNLKEVLIQTWSEMWEKLK